MDRASLEGLTREALIEHAEQAGILRARILTRPELIDEIVVRVAANEEDASTVARARGFFGRARDLLSDVVQKGLHLPDAADRLRAMFGPPPEIQRARDALPTVTLAEIYVAQGHRARALETLKRVLAEEPEHAAARALLMKLEDRAFPVPKPKLPPEEDEIEHAKERARLRAKEDAEEEAAAKDVDECVGILCDATTLFVAWSCRAKTIAHLRGQRARGRVVLRVLVVAPSWSGPKTANRDLDLHAVSGDYFVRELPERAIVRVAVGWLEDGVFHAIAHSASVSFDRDAQRLVRWGFTAATPLSVHESEATPIFRAHTLMQTRLREHSPRQSV